MKGRPTVGRYTCYLPTRYQVDSALYSLYSCSSLRLRCVYILPIVNGVQSHATDAMFICRVCKLYVKKDSMPPSCVLNDLHLHPVPQCLSRLNSFEKLLIQKLEPFQTCYKLDTKHGSRPHSKRVRCHEQNTPPSIAN